MKASIALSLVCAAFLLFGVVLWNLRPAMPENWRQLRSGMERSEVLSIIGGDTFDAREIKGFEVTGKETHMAGMPAYWQIFLRYDESERLISAEARFVNRTWGIFSTDEASVFP